MSKEKQPSEQNSSKKYQLTDWSTRLLRLTVFPHGPQVAKVEDWWQAIVGDRPDKIQASPKQNHIWMQSTYGLGMLTLDVTPIAANWIYQVSSDPEAPEDGLALSLGGVESALKVFSEITDKWFAIDSASEAKRVAFGAILEIPALNQEDAYETLSSFLPNIGLDENCSDLVYRINRRRLIEFDELQLRINRISKWAAPALAIAYGNSSFMSQPQIESITTQLELDINTDQNYSDVMSLQLQQKILAKLISLGLEIAERGDVP